MTGESLLRQLRTDGWYSLTISTSWVEMGVLSQVAALDTALQAAGSRVKGHIGVYFPGYSSTWEPGKTEEADWEIPVLREYVLEIARQFPRTFDYIRKALPGYEDYWDRFLRPLPEKQTKILRREPSEPTGKGFCRQPWTYQDDAGYSWGKASPSGHRKLMQPEEPEGTPFNENERDDGTIIRRKRETYAGLGARGVVMEPEWLQVIARYRVSYSDLGQVIRGLYSIAGMHDIVRYRATAAEGPAAGREARLQLLDELWVLQMDAYGDRESAAVKVMPQCRECRSLITMDRAVVGKVFEGLCYRAFGDGDRFSAWERKNLSLRPLAQAIAEAAALDPGFYINLPGESVKTPRSKTA